MTIVKAAVNGEIVADLTQAQAEAVTGRIREWVKGCPVGDIKAAFFGRVWLGMGYESWAEWCDCELDGFMLPTPERREVVEELSRGGYVESGHRRCGRRQSRTPSVGI
jgi:hypothetical protein